MFSMSAELQNAAAVDVVSCTVLPSRTLKSENVLKKRHQHQIPVGNKIVSSRLGGVAWPKFCLL